MSDVIIRNNMTNIRLIEVLRVMGWKIEQESKAFKDILKEAYSASHEQDMTIDKLMEWLKNELQSLVDEPSSSIR
jgi:L,D-peptidoglycan transpeptidase YkuD (ErfK/YbiS/YcfS/YnhG family)